MTVTGNITQTMFTGSQYGYGALRRFPSGDDQTIWTHVSPVPIHARNADTQSEFRGYLRRGNTFTVYDMSRGYHQPTVGDGGRIPNLPRWHDPEAATSQRPDWGLLYPRKV